jgi:uncharacterized SAM-binding protein YcdF (DUF218 family)
MKGKPIGILLGGGISKEGNLNLKCEKRADKALSLIKNNEVNKLILSGKCSHGEPFKTEARAYFDYLVSKGVVRNKLILEENSRDTIGNAVYSKKIILRMKLPKNLIILTGKNHIDRALWVFSRVFGKDYSIKGVYLNSGNFLIISKIVELIKWAIDRFILSKLNSGDHINAEKMIKRYLFRYYN